MFSALVHGVGKSLAWVCIFLIVTPNCLADENYSTDADVTLSGKVDTKQFADANDRQETAVLLILDQAIDVKEDAFGGPVAGVNELQLALLAHVKNYKGKCVRVAGRLFYPITAHHHTKVLLKVKSITMVSCPKE